MFFHKLKSSLKNTFSNKVNSGNSNINSIPMRDKRVRKKKETKSKIETKSSNINVKLFY